MRADDGPVSRSRPRWRMPAVGVGLVAGVFGFAALRPVGLDDGSPSTTVALATDAEPIAVCTRASLEDRAALVLVVGLPGVTTADAELVDRLADIGVGGVMLRDENITGEEQTQELVAGLRDRLGADLLVAVDDEGGRVSSMGELGQSVSSARRVGQAGEDAAEEAGAELGELAASVDIDWVFGPVADLDDGPASGVIGNRSFGADPHDVAVTAGAFARGLRQAGVAVTVKHFPGHGGTGDPHRGDTIDNTTLASLNEQDLVPFRALIDDGAETVMVGHVSYPQMWDDLPASLEPRAYALLRAQGFDGVAITDALGMGAVHARYGFDVAPALALAAGADAVLVTQGDQVEMLHAGVVAAVREGRLDEDRLDEAVSRVLALRDQSSEGTVCPA
jgi:beta-N-acetylhexosaminidase